MTAEEKLYNLVEQLAEMSKLLSRNFTVDELEAHWLLIVGMLKAYDLIKIKNKV